MRAYGSRQTTLPSRTRWPVAAARKGNRRAFMTADSDASSRGRPSSAVMHAPARSCASARPRRCERSPAPCRPAIAAPTAVQRPNRWRLEGPAPSRTPAWPGRSRAAPTSRRRSVDRPRRSPKASRGSGGPTKTPGEMQAPGHPPRTAGNEPQAHFVPGPVDDLDVARLDETVRPGSQSRVSTTMKPMTQVAASKRNSSTCPMRPSVATRW